MFRGRRFALMLMRRWTAPTRPVRHRERAQCHRTEQSYPAVQSVAAWSEPLTSSEEGKPEEDASCCDPDKGLTWRQEAFNHVSSNRWLGSRSAWQGQVILMPWPSFVIDSV